MTKNHVFDPSFHARAHALPAHVANRPSTALDPPQPSHQKCPSGLANPAYPSPHNTLLGCLLMGMFVQWHCCNTKGSHSGCPESSWYPPACSTFGHVPAWLLKAACHMPRGVLMEMLHVTRHSASLLSTARLPLWVSYGMQAVRHVAGRL